MEESNKPMGYWRNKDRIISVITMTSSRSEFYEKFPGAAAAAKAMGIYQELTDMMVSKGLWQRKSYVRWTKKTCVAEIRKYNNTTDLLQNNMGAYLYARKHGFWEEESKRMEKRGSLRLRKIYVFEFEDGYAYVGLAYNPSKRKKDHLKDIESAVNIHIRETNSKFDFKELTDFLEKDIASKKEEEFRQQYKNDGWHMLNRMKCGSLGALGSQKYSKEMTQIIAKKYNCRSDFNIHDKGAYLFAYKNGWLDEICSGMPKFKGREEPTEEEIQNTIKQCKNRTELKSHHTKIWNILVESGRIEEYFPRKKSLEELWPDEKLLEAIDLCKNRRELMKNYRGAYDLLRKDGRIDYYFPLTKAKKKIIKQKNISKRKK